MNRARSVLAATLAILTSPGALLASEPPQAVGTGTWLRVTTGPEVATDDYGLSGEETHGRTLSKDKRTVTFEVNGRPVRVARPGKVFEGRLEASNEQTLVLVADANQPPIVVPRQAIAKVDLKRRPSWKGRGALIGALAGGIVGGILNASEDEPKCGENEPAGPFCLDLNMEEVAVVGVAIVGALVGFVVAPGTKWEKDIARDRVQVGVRPVRGGVGMALAIKF